MSNSTRKVRNGTWYEVCVIQDGEPRDVIVENNMYAAEKRVEALANQWPDCDMIFVRQHRKDPKRGEGASTYRILRTSVRASRAVSRSSEIARSADRRFQEDQSVNNRTNVIEATREISRNADRMNTWAWIDMESGERAKILMELRHDLESALKSVREMEGES